MIADAIIAITRVIIGILAIAITVIVIGIVARTTTDQTVRARRKVSVRVHRRPSGHLSHARKQDLRAATGPAPISGREAMSRGKSRIKKAAKFAAFSLSELDHIFLAGGFQHVPTALEAGANDKTVSRLDFAARAALLTHDRATG